jgi:hypothetical protein
VGSRVGHGHLLPPTCLLPVMHVKMDNRTQIEREHYCIRSTFSSRVKTHYPLSVRNPANTTVLPWYALPNDISEERDTAGLDHRSVDSCLIRHGSVLTRGQCVCLHYTAAVYKYFVVFMMRVSLPR